MSKPDGSAVPKVGRRHREVEPEIDPRELEGWFARMPAAEQELCRRRWERERYEDPRTLARRKEARRRYLIEGAVVFFLAEAGFAVLSYRRIAFGPLLGLGAGCLWWRQRSGPVASFLLGLPFFTLNRVLWGWSHIFMTILEVWVFSMLCIAAGTLRRSNLLDGSDG